MNRFAMASPGYFFGYHVCFFVLGGYLASTGLLTFYVAKTSFRDRTPGVAWVVAFTGLTSIGLMAMVNFIISSDFRWLLLLFTLPWMLSLWLFYYESRSAKINNNIG